MTEVPFQGKASLADLATTKEGKEALKKRNWKEVVVYDDSSEDLSSLPYSHTLFLVINSLLEDGRQPVMLIGGLRAFQVPEPLVNECVCVCGFSGDCVLNMHIWPHVANHTACLFTQPVFFFQYCNN